ncbi:hypothetical protein BGX23_005865 [Mortierella sp. AD031]|nr:hypothetical protein BGX23_005865 [Mortierella sp. AD031]
MSTTTTAKATEPNPASTPSSTHSSPELRAADILKERQQRQREHKISIEEKHSTLNQIDSVLDDLSRELDEVIAGQIENKKQILQTEENLTKAMFRIDSVESDGEVSVRRRRKELIKKSQALLDLVDEFKARNVAATAIATKPVEPAEETVEPETDASSAENDVEMTEVAPEAPAAETEVESTTATSKPAESTEEEQQNTELLDTLSEIESLPDVDADHSQQDAEEANTPADSNDTPVESSSSEAPAAEYDESEHESESESEHENETEENKGPAFDPLDLIIDAALDLARPSDPADHDFEMVLVH